jgi:hypothetical protein
MFGVQPGVQLGVQRAAGERGAELGDLGAELFNGHGGLQRL